MSLNKKLYQQINSVDHKNINVNSLVKINKENIENIKIYEEEIINLNKNNKSIINENEKLLNESKSYKDRLNMIEEKFNIIEEKSFSEKEQLEKFQKENNDLKE